MSFWFKALIVTIWLGVPLAASVLVRSSYQVYQGQCTIQRQDCLDRSAFLNTYSSAYDRLAGQVGRITNQESHRTWVRDYRELEQMETNSALSLRPQEPVHYPQTDLELGVLEGNLRDLRTNVKQAAYYRLDYYNAGERLNSLLAMEFDLERTIFYYKQIGMEGIYLQLQEELAKVEDELQSIRRQRRRYLEWVEQALTDSKEAHRAIQRSLNHLQSKLDEDEQQTFRQELHQRFAEFSLIQEIKALWVKAG